jgi:hypothetical protein
VSTAGGTAQGGHPPACAGVEDTGPTTHGAAVVWMLELTLAVHLQAIRTIGTVGDRASLKPDVPEDGVRAEERDTDTTITRGCHLRTPSWWTSTRHVPGSPTPQASSRRRGSCSRSMPVA